MPPTSATQHAIRPDRFDMRLARVVGGLSAACMCAPRLWWRGCPRAARSMFRQAIGFWRAPDDNSSAPAKGVLVALVGGGPACGAVVRWPPGASERAVAGGVYCRIAFDRARFVEHVAGGRE